MYGCQSGKPNFVRLTFRDTQTAKIIMGRSLAPRNRQQGLWICDRPGREASTVWIFQCLIRLETCAPRYDQTSKLRLQVPLGLPVLPVGRAGDRSREVIRTSVCEM
jgi:hypothetical protein